MTAPRPKSRRHLDEARQERLTRLRMEDDVLEDDASLSPQDQSLSAQQVREAAAAIRADRADALTSVEFAIQDAGAPPAAGTAQPLSDDRAWTYYAAGRWVTRRLRVWRLQDGRLATVLTERPGEEGMSITNAAEAIAAKLALDFPGETILQIEHYAAGFGDHEELVDGVAIVGGAPTWWPIPRDQVLAMFGDIYETDQD